MTTTFKSLTAALAIAGLGVLTGPVFAQSGASPANAQASDQDHSAHRPEADAPKGADSGQMKGMQAKMMADMQAQDARLKALVEKMNAATGAAKTDAMAELLTALVQQHASMRDGMMQMMHGSMMMQGQAMKPMGGAK